jgi:hypothetical protein
MKPQKTKDLGFNVLECEWLHSFYVIHLNFGVFKAGGILNHHGDQDGCNWGELSERLCIDKVGRTNSGGGIYLLY